MRSHESSEQLLETNDEVLDAPVPLAHHLHRAGLLEDFGHVRLVTGEAPPVREFTPLRRAPPPQGSVRHEPPPVRALRRTPRSVERAAPLRITPQRAETRAITPDAFGTLEPAVERSERPMSVGPMAPAMLVAGGMIAGLFATFLTLLLTRF